MPPMFGAQVPKKNSQDRGGAKALPDAVTALSSLLALPPQTESTAPFLGDYTTITASPGNGMVMFRETDCSLTAFNVPYAENPSNPYSPPDSKTTGYGSLLHSAAGLTTTAGMFAGGCTDPKTGIESNDILYAGQATSGMRMGAAAVYSPSADANVLYTYVIQSNGTYVGETQQTLANNNMPQTVAAGDLNGDGNPDLIAIGNGAVATGGASLGPTMISVLLGNADGTFTVGQTYTLTSTSYTDSAVIDDFNGDGKLDVVVAEGGQSAGVSGSTEKLTFLPGNGDGTFGTPVSLTLSGTTAENIISGDFNGDKKKDIASGSGYIYFGNGDGTFQTPSAPAFSSPISPAAYLATGDFNADGNLDIAAGTGESIYIYIGNGQGAFTYKAAYASIANHGQMTVTDLDGDGKMDIFSGNAENGVFSGDQGNASEGYVLMGRGDGTFVGAPQVTNATFLNLQDLNGDGKLDFIGTIDGNSITGGLGTSFATYLGNGDGTFTQPGAALNLSSITYQGTSYQISNPDSYATGDISGDGHPDLIVDPGILYPTGSNQPLRPGLITAIANADGSFQAPSYTPVPPLLADGGTDQDYIYYLGNVTGAVDQNGKFEAIYGYNTGIYNSNTNAATYNLGYATQVSNGDGTLAAPVTTVIQTSNTQLLATDNINSATPPAIVKIVDFNGDKIPDLLLDIPVVFGMGGTVISPETLAVMLGKADGTFATAVNLTLPQPYSSGQPVTIGDLNSDGIPDLAFETEVNTQTATSYYLEVAIGKGDGTFTTPAPLLLYNFEGLGSPAIGDFNGDGKGDIAIAGSGVYPGKGDGTFQTVASSAGDGSVVPPISLPLDSAYGPSAAYDVNGDGKIDLVEGGTFLIQVAPPATTTTLNNSATALTASASSLTVSQSVTLTATVTAASGSGTPTGTVAFLDGTTSLGTGTLNASGVATFSTTALAAGSHSITASYGGDANFAASTSTAATITVAAPAPDFSVSLSSTSATVSAGASATTTISISPANGFNQAVTFACSGLPSGASCTFAPNSVTPSGSSAATTTLTIATTATSSKLVPLDTHQNGSRGVIAWAALFLGLTGLARTRRQWRRSLGALQVLFMIVLLAGLAGCGGSGDNNKNQSTTSSVTVTATAGTNSHTATFTLTVK